MTPRTLVPAFAVLVLLLAASARPQFTPLLDPALRDLLHEELSGELAKEHVIAITRHHRIQGSRGYRDAAHYVLERLRGCGYGEERAWIESFPSDGRVHYQTWQSPSGWHVERAELRLVEPADERLVAYPEIAMSLMTYSNAGAATGELVWVGRGTSEEDYTGKDVAGKLVLATGYGGDVHRLAVLSHGAAAVVSYLDDERALDHPDMLAYTGLWPRTEELERVRFGFNLTHRQGERLRRMLERGERVVLSASVEGPGIESYFMDVVVATILGRERPEEELVFVAHLDHPKESANDNASGSAALLDIARTFATLIEQGRLPAPARTLRFLWVPEFFGTMAYVDRHPELVGPELGGSVLACLNLDMVGEDTAQIPCRLELTRTPDSLPSVLPDVVANMAAMVEALDVRTPRGGRTLFDWRMTPYAPGSDHMIFLDRKIPAVMFSHAPDWTHHTSEDTPDKVDPVQLERCALIAAATNWYLANLTEEQALDLLAYAQGEAVARLGSAAHRARRTAVRFDLPSERDRAQHAAARWGLHARWREESVLASLASFGAGVPIDEAVRAAQERVVAFAESCSDGAAARPVSSTHAFALVPGRLTRGPLALDLLDRLPRERAAYYRSPECPLSTDMRFEIVNWIDGERSTLRISSALADAYELEVEHLAMEPHVERYLDDLVSLGVVEWVEDSLKRRLYEERPERR